MEQIENPIEFKQLGKGLAWARLAAASVTELSINPRM